MFHIVLVEPEIPANTGNIGRTCVLTGAKLHLVGPLGFSLDDASLKRAGLAYWESLDVAVYDDWDEFLERNPDAARGLSLQSPSEPASPSMHLLTKSGTKLYTQAAYHDGDYLVFGKESAGLDAQLLAAQPQHCERIPMLGDDALSNAGDWHATFDDLHPGLERDICGNYVDPRAGQVASLNLGNAVAIVLYEALRQVGFGM